MKLKRSSINDGLNIDNVIDLCTNVDGKITESLMNGYQSLTFRTQKKFLMLGNSSLRNRSCVNKLSFIKKLKLLQEKKNKNYFIEIQRISLFYIQSKDETEFPNLLLYIRPQKHHLPFYQNLEWTCPSEYKGKKN